MKKLGTALKSAALGALALGAMAGSAYAGAVTEPGVTIGGAPGSPIPEGVFFINNFNWGNDNFDTHHDLGIEVPVLVWATPYHILGGQLILAATVPGVAVDTPASSTKFEAFLNTGASLAWNLGNGFNISTTFDLYFPGLADGNSYVPEGRVGLSYLKDGWNLSAQVIAGFPAAPETGGAQQNDYVNLDLAAIKTMGKWQLGAVAFGTWDTNIAASNLATGKQSRFAVGGLVGYEFGPITAQVIYTHDVSDTNLPVADSRIWTQFVVPLWVAQHEPLK